MGAIQQVLVGYGAGVSVPNVYFNPAAKDSKITLSNADATATRNAGASAWCAVLGLTSHASGKWYAEIADDADGVANGNMIFGVATSAATLTSYVGSDAFGWGIQANNMTNLTIYHSGTPTSQGSGGNAIGVGGRAMVAYDAGTGQIWLGSAGAWFALGNPAAGTGANYTTTAGTALVLALSAADSPQQCTLKNNPGENFYTIPSGYSMWG
jgi:hypothetical protein